MKKQVATWEQRDRVRVALQAYAEQPVSRAQLREIAGLSDRVMRNAVSQLIIECREPIVSLNSGGYMFTTDKGKLFTSARRIASQAAEMRDRARALDEIAVSGIHEEAQVSATGGGQKATRCISECWQMPECSVCHRPKPPRGRSVAAEAASSYCEHECSGYELTPRSGHHWPNEECDDNCK